MNVAKNFHVHQLTLTLATTARFTDILLQEVKCPSRMFKQFAVKNWVRLETDPEVLAAVTAEAVPAVQRMLLNQLLLQREQAALDKLAGKMMTELPDICASFLHGCSEAVVRKGLNDDHILKSKQLRGLIGKFHWRVLLERHEDKLQDKYEKHGYDAFE